MSEKENIDQFSTFSFDDFIQNEYFIASILHPDENSQIFWNSFESKCYPNLEDYLLAKEFIVSLNNSQKIPERNEVTELWNNISKNTFSTKKTVYRYITIAVSMAACVMLFFLFWNPKVPLSQDDILSFAMNTTQKDEKQNDIKLVLSDEKTVIFEENVAEINYNPDGITISDQKISEVNVSSYNQLIVPNGKRSVLTLSDSSKIWVNAGTRLIYPSVFQNDKREIYVEGEVLLDVASDMHRPFIVRTSKLDIKVLGTEFNVSTHGNEEIAVVIVSGAVNISSPNRDHLLKPNDVYTYKNGTETINHEDDIYKHISWREGLYIFDSERLDAITARLSRYYGIPVQCHETVANMKCSGKLDLKEKVESLLQGLALTVPIRYSFKEDTIFIDAQ